MFRHASAVTLAIGIAAAALVACGGVPAGSSRPLASASAPSPQLTSTPVAAVTTAPASATPTASIASASDEISGRFDIGNRSLLIECRGSSGPTVVFLVGSGAPRDQMRVLADDLLPNVRVCEYDRRQDDTASEEDHVNDLAALLEAAGVPAPYLLVGQSVGGNIAWLYANRHPDDVAAFMAMNAGPFALDCEEMKEYWTPEEIADECPEPGSERERNALTLQGADPPAWVPYVVMLSTIAQCESPTDICGRFYPAYEAWARELVSRSSNGRFVQVPAGHEIFDGPAREPVLEEVRRLLSYVE